MASRRRQDKAQLLGFQSWSASYNKPLKLPCITQWSIPTGRAMIWTRACGAKAVRIHHNIIHHVAAEGPSFLFNWYAVVLLCVHHNEILAAVWDHSWLLHSYFEQCQTLISQGPDWSKDWNTSREMHELCSVTHYQSEQNLSHPLDVKKNTMWSKEYEQDCVRELILM